MCRLVGGNHKYLTRWFSENWFKEPGYHQKTDEIVCQLNSKPLDFFKHIAAIKAGGYYSYRTQYVEQLPCIINGNSDVEKELRETISKITDLLDTDNRTDRFPEAYLELYDGDLGYINYEWQIRRYLGTDYSLPTLL